jgi:hypothetical protein
MENSMELVYAAEVNAIANDAQIVLNLINASSEAKKAWDVAFSIAVHAEMRSDETLSRLLVARKAIVDTSADVMLVDSTETMLATANASAESADVTLATANAKLKVAEEWAAMVEKLAFDEEVAGKKALDAVVIALKTSKCATDAFAAMAHAAATEARAFAAMAHAAATEARAFAAMAHAAATEARAFARMVKAVNDRLHIEDDMMSKKSDSSK